MGIALPRFEDVNERFNIGGQYVVPRTIGNCMMDFLWIIHS